MAINENVKNHLAETLYQAEESRRPVAPLTERYPDLTLTEARAIQREIIDRKVKRGDRLAGKKVGLTSRALQHAFGVDQPGYGILFDAMRVENNGQLSFDELILPKVEAEIVFVLKQDLKGPGVTEADVISASDYCVPALEIADSRIRDWKVKLVDAVADNLLAGRFVLGDRHTAVDQVDLRLLGVVLEKNGQLASTGAGAAVLGNPLLAVAWLANKLAEVGDRLNPGDMILSGAIAGAVAVTKGDVVTAQFDRLGSVSVRFV